MNKLSRRQLASYGADQLMAGRAINKVAQELAAALIAMQKPKEADLLIQDIAWQLETRGQAAVASVSVAQPMSSDLKDNLTKQLKTALNVKDVEIDETVDQKLIGGLRIDTATRSWDKTLLRTLMDIREAF